MFCDGLILIFYPSSRSAQKQPSCMITIMEVLSYDHMNRPLNFPYIAGLR